MNGPAIVAAARRANAGYVIDPALSKAAFEAIGLTWLGQYKDADSQAVLSRDATGNVYLTMSGTRFSAGKLGDLADDIDIWPVSLGDGVEVTRGAYESCAEIWNWAKAQVPADTVFNVEGHSLGGWRTVYTPLFLPAERIGSLHAFEPPKGANAAYYAKYEAELCGLVIVGNGQDVWFGYPRSTDRWIHRPGEMLHFLGDGVVRVIDTAQWPGGLDFSDHDMELVLSRVESVFGVPAAESVAA